MGSRKPSATAGNVVELHSLSTVGFNGRRGMCSCVDPQTGRHQVSLFATKTAPARTTSVRPCNITVVSAGFDKSTKEHEQMLPKKTPLGPGSSGPDVVMLQKVLIKLGYMHPSAIRCFQGFYGPRTTASVAKIAKAIGSAGGGVFTDHVRAHLLRRLASAKDRAAVPVPTTKVTAAVPAPTTKVTAVVPVPTTKVTAAVPVPTKKVTAAVSVPTKKVTAAVTVPTTKVTATVPVPTTNVTATVSVPTTTETAAVPVPTTNVTTAVSVPTTNVTAAVPVPTTKVTATVAMPTTTEMTEETATVPPQVQQLRDMGFALPVETLINVLAASNNDVGAALTALVGRE